MFSFSRRPADDRPSRSAGSPARRGTGRGVAAAASLLLAGSGSAAEADGWTTSRLAGSPEPALPFKVEKIFTGIEWKAPIFAAEEPGSDHLVVVQHRGAPDQPLLLRVPNDPAAAEAAPLLTVPEWLIYSVAFDPEYVTNRFIYLFQNGPTGHEPRGNRISRYRMADEPAPHVDLESELRILEWRSGGHDGGDLAFGSDGMLYITTGDGSTDSDAWVTGQTLDDLLGAVLRIDVSRATEDRPYEIPQDNPFVGEAGARPEIWAYGLRNPWRMGIDLVSSQVWVGNNGQDLWETAHLVRPGDNYGWSVYEGSYPFYLNRQLGPTPHVKPTIEHHHSEFRSLTGGIVYRGSKWPELDGAYVYGDYSTGRIWGAMHDGERMIWHRELADTTLAIAGFRAVTGGDLLVIDHLGSAIYRLARSDAPRLTAPFPQTLSETGLFQSVSTGEVVPEAGVVPYEVNSPGWNDGARAQRWIAAPAGERIGYAAGGPWTFPDGTALVQMLSLPSDSEAGGAERPVETRILLRQQGEWDGYSYRWREDGSDADLVPKGGAVDDVPGGDVRTQTWQFPSRTECAVCHNRAANYVLGITGAQLNRDVKSEGNQLRLLEAQGLFSAALPADLPEPMAHPHDASADLDSRVRSYLHTNCSICHVEAGGGNAMMDLRLGIPRDRMGIFEARPQHATFGLPNAMIVAPGDPDRSVLQHRISRRGSASGQMPPLGSARTDEDAVRMIRQWIEQMTPAQPPVRHWEMADFLPQLESLESGRSYLAGREAFTATGCIQCHRFAGAGGSVGPDLTGIGRRLTRGELLEAILEPSKKIAEGYAVPGAVPPLSTMPPAMVDVLTKEQVLDLLYYLERDGRPRVAAVVTEYRRNSHADVIVSRLLQTDTLDGKGRESPLELVSLFTDQTPASDTSRQLSAAHGFPIFPTIREALTLGSGELAVDGVLLIAEHGDYPLSATGNRQYPKRRFWDEVRAVFQESKRSVPVFIDKHLADNWEDAEFIYSSAREMGVPLMAGSSLPVAWRRPPADVERGAGLREIVAITYHTTDAYGFHALEFVQALAEQRRGGESGIAAVQATSGDAVWRAMDEETFDTELFEAAWSRLTKPRDPEGVRREAVPDPRLLSIEYADGLQVRLLELNGAASEWSAAWRCEDPDKPIESALFWTQEGRPAMHFTWLLNGIEQMILTGTPSWNVERTLMTSGTLDALLVSLSEGGRRIETPYLNISYQPTWRWTPPPPPPPTRSW